MLHAPKFVFAVFLSVVFFHSFALAEVAVSPGNFTFIDEAKKKQGEVIKSRLGVLSKAVGLGVGEAGNMALMYYSCNALSSIGSNLDSCSRASQFDISGDESFPKDNMCLLLVSVVGPKEAAMVSRSSPWPNVSPWLEVFQVFGSAGSGYYMYMLKNIQSVDSKAVSLDVGESRSLAAASGVFGYLAMSSLGSTLSALGTSVIRMRTSDFDSETSRRFYIFRYKIVDLSLISAMVGTGARFGFAYIGHPEKRAVPLSIILSGLTGMLASFAVTDEPGYVTWAYPVEFPSYNELTSNPSDAIDGMIRSFQLPVSYVNKGKYDLGAGGGAIVGLVSGAIAAAVYAKAGLGATVVYSALASSAGAIAGAGTGLIFPIAGGLVGVLIIPLIQKHSPLEEVGGRNLILQTAASTGGVIFINSVVNFLLDWQSIEDSLTETNQWIWRKLHAPVDYINHVLSLD